MLGMGHILMKTGITRNPPRICVNFLQELFIFYVLYYAYGFSPVRDGPYPDENKNYRTYQESTDSRFSFLAGTVHILYYSVFSLPYLQVKLEMVHILVKTGITKNLLRNSQSTGILLVQMMTLCRLLHTTRLHWVTTLVMLKPGQMCTILWMLD